MWSSLIDELDRWQSRGIVATFWWRDDDAISRTKELDQLLEFAHDIPLSLSVIPSLLEESLIDAVSYCANLTVLQHGWRHENRAIGGENSEYPAGRDSAELKNEFSLGRHTLSQAFGTRYVPVFAPPWHNFCEAYELPLSEAGIRAISRKGPRYKPVAGRLTVSNVHCVPIRWGTPPSFGKDAEYLHTIVDHLEGRRNGRYDSSEPTGLLTHHLVQNPASYVFLKNLAKLILEHPAARWVDAWTVFNVRDDNGDISCVSNLV